MGTITQGALLVLCVIVLLAFVALVGYAMHDALRDWRNRDGER